MAQETLENRVALLEKEVARLRSELAQQNTEFSEADFFAELERVRSQYPATPPIGKTNPEQIERLSGLFPDDALFEAAVRAGQEWRYADRPHDDQDELLKEPNHAVPA